MFFSHFNKSIITILLGMALFSCSFLSGNQEKTSEQTIKKEPFNPSVSERAAAARDSEGGFIFGGQKKIY